LAEQDPIAVIGAGVVGASVGYHLARSGAPVLLVDAGHPGGLTTSASFAWVNASAKVGRGSYFDLNFAGLKEYERMASELTDTSWWNQTGHLRWDYRDAAELHGTVELLASRGYAAEVWEASEARRMLGPEIEVASPSGLVLVLRDEGWVDGPRMVQSLVEAAVANGARTAFGSVVRSITTRSAAVAAVELADGRRIAVSGVVNAAGPAADTIAALVGRTLPMKESRGLVVRVAIDDAPVRCVIHAPGISIRPDGPGRLALVAHSVESELPSGGHAPRRLVEQVQARAWQIAPALARASVTDARVGQRPIPADDLPAIGAASEIHGYYEAVMHSGITLGPFVGRALAGEIVHGRIDPLVASFRASRLSSGAGSGLTRRQGVFRV
jgi:glycine/D-amino acid oxidase-like deaminating enzyme